MIQAIAITYLDKVPCTLLDGRNVASLTLKSDGDSGNVQITSIIYP